MILGLDCSTKVLGWSVLDKSNGEMIDGGALDLSKHDGLFDKYFAVKEFFRTLYDKHTITTVALEDFARRHSASNINTIIMLAQMNGFCQLASFEIFNVKPFLYNVATARKYVVGTIPHIAKNRKEYVFYWFLKNLPQYTKFLIRRPPSKKDKDDVKRFNEKSKDIVDSFVIAKNCYIQLQSDEVF